jgi:predicted helicase
MPLAPANMRQSLPDAMAFRKDWRVYQSRLLDHLDRFLGNKRLHLVAAPGSGKTVLGLEVVRRVNQPTLVLAPTCDLPLLAEFKAKGEKGKTATPSLSVIVRVGVRNALFRPQCHHGIDIRRAPSW